MTMRYVLLFDTGGINVGANDEGRPYLVEGKNGWRSAVAELTRRVQQRNQGKIVNLEIQSHGLPGTIVAAGGNITNENVTAFGAALRAVMQSGGLIEIMACLVASFTRFTFSGGTIKYGPEVLDPYLNAFESDPVHWSDKDPNTRKMSVIRITDPDRLKSLKTANDERRTALWSYQDNGLEFCLQLARTSGAIVRASRLVQMEEYGPNTEYNSLGVAVSSTTEHPIMGDYDRFGDWDGPVWDFMPNGTVKYLGCGIPRHKFRFPEHRNPQQLTYNFRQQDGKDTGVGQRPQRMNRNSLPV
jgi:hypothetical protein